MRNLDELNINNSGKKPQGLLLSSQEIVSLERQLGVNFPEQYIAFLRFANGGHTELDAFPFYGKEGGSINHFYALTTSDEDQQGVLNNTYFLRGVLRSELSLSKPVVAIAENGGGDMIFMDCEPNSNLIYILYRSSGNSIVPVADSFEAFVDSLYLDPDYI